MHELAQSASLFVPNLSELNVLLVANCGGCWVPFSPELSRSSVRFSCVALPNAPLPQLCFGLLFTFEPVQPLGAF